MPTKRERDYYRMGYQDGFAHASRPDQREYGLIDVDEQLKISARATGRSGKKRKLSAWNKYVKANSKKPRFRFANGKLKLKKMAIAFRKTPAGRKKKRR